MQPTALPAKLSGPDVVNLSERVPGTYALRGEIAQTVTISLEAGQAMWASKGAILSHDTGIQWQLKIPGAAVSRMLSGEGLALTHITANRPGASVTLSANLKGPVIWPSNGPPASVHVQLS